MPLCSKNSRICKISIAERFVCIVVIKMYNKIRVIVKNVFIIHTFCQKSVLAVVSKNSQAACKVLCSTLAILVICKLKIRTDVSRCPATGLEHRMVGRDLPKLSYGIVLNSILVYK